MTAKVFDSKGIPGRSAGDNRPPRPAISRTLQEAQSFSVGNRSFASHLDIKRVPGKEY